MDGRLDRFEAYYKDAFEKMQKQIDFETTSLKDGLGQFMNQIWPKIALLDKMDGRFDKIMTMQNTHGEQLNEVDAKVKKHQKQLRDFQRTVDDITIMKDQYDSMN